MKKFGNTRPEKKPGKTYSEKLRDPRWQKKRLNILNRDDWTCQNCGDKEATLHVHHMVYERDNEPWEYDDNILVTLCESCHENEKEQMQEFSMLFMHEIKKRFLSGDILNMYESIIDTEISPDRYWAAGIIGSQFRTLKVDAAKTKDYVENYNAKEEA